jgi:hypothetical protein
MRPATKIALAFTLFSTASDRAASAQTIDPYQFELKYAPAVDDPHVLIDFPTVAVLVRGNRIVPGSVADQLTEAINDALAAEPALGPLSIDRRPAAGGGEHWSLVASSQPPRDNAPLIDGFARSLEACFRSLPDDVATNVLYFLLSGGSLDSQQRGLATGAGAAMNAGWRTDKCATSRNRIPLRSTRIRNIAEGMLTEMFDRNLFGDQSIVDLVTALKPLFYSSTGLWVSDKVPRLRRALDIASRRFFSQGSFEPFLQTTYASFWDWAAAVAYEKPDHLYAFVTSIADACASGPEELQLPFSLLSCLEAGRVTLPSLRVGNVDFIAATAEGLR